MSVPSKNWSTIADAAVDPDSALDTTLITAVRDNLVHVYEWLGYGYTAQQAHNHDGVNSTLLPGNVMGSLFAFHRFT